MISKGNHVKFARFVLLAVSEETKTWLPVFVVQCILKQLLDSGFVISGFIQNNQGLGKRPWLYLDLDYSGYHKNLIQ